MLSLHFLRSSRSSSFWPCVTCARMCAQACVYGVCQNAGTSEPTSIPFLFHRVSGSRAVPERFQLEPFGCFRMARPVSSTKPNILAGGNGRELVRIGPDRAASNVERGRGGESFGDCARPGSCSSWCGSGRIELTRCARARSANGGILRFLPGRIGHVGKAMFEASRQGIGSAGFSGARRQPVRLAQGSRGRLDPARAPAHPVCPHRGRAGPQGWSRGTLAKFGSSIRLPELRRSRAEDAECSAAATGRGQGWKPDQGAMRATGRGEMAGLSAGEWRPGRNSEATARCASVKR